MISIGDTLEPARRRRGPRRLSVRTEMIDLRPLPLRRRRSWLARLLRRR